MEILLRFKTYCGIYLRFHVVHSYWKEVKCWTFRDTKWKNEEKKLERFYYILISSSILYPDIYEHQNTFSVILFFGGSDEDLFFSYGHNIRIRISEGRNRIRNPAYSK